MAPGRVVVGLSGGVDSSLAAALLVEEGYTVCGVMLRLWAEPRAGEDEANRCCAPEAIESARLLAAKLGIPFQLVDAREEFRRAVVEPFVAEYGRGRTPNPCIWCNKDVRFRLLLRLADAYGAEHVATGHYARAQRAAGGAWQLWRGVDRDKDQSYFLYRLGQEELARALFPLGRLRKQEVRQMALARSLPAAQREESQDLCFVAEGDYRRFLARAAPELLRPGPILDRAGRVLGEHQGLAAYTVGQRRGLRIAAGRPLYVLELRPQENALVVGPEEELGARALLAVGVHWVEGGVPGGPLRLEVQIRYRARPAPALVVPRGEEAAFVYFERPLRDITPGQSAVFYEGERCLGGGVIERALREEELGGCG